MHVDTLEQIEPAVLKIQGLLQKIDRLQLPTSSRLDVESILIRQVSKEIDRALPWQAGHGTRTADIATIIGQQLGLDAGELHDLKLAALLHDIGLLMLPVHLRAGSKPLDPESYIAIQSHSRLGASLLEPFLFVRAASILIAHHHERWDGSGYPYGIRREFIPLGARILAVADAFEAIQVPGVSDQTVRDRIALHMLRVASGTQFDPSVVGALTAAVVESRSACPVPGDSQGLSACLPLAPEWEIAQSHFTGGVLTASRGLRLPSDRGQLIDTPVGTDSSQRDSKSRAQGCLTARGC